MNPEKVELELAIKALREELKVKDRKIADLHFTLEEYGIEEESQMSDEHFICVNEISRLRDLSETATGLDDKEVKMFEILNKSLQMIKGGVKKKSPKGKTYSKAELLKLVDGGGE